MKEQILDILKDGINDIDSVKKQYPKMNTQDVIDVLRRLQDRINELTIPVVKNWLSVKDSMPENCDQVFVKYENGKYGINEWWESDNCWKYQFDNMIVKEWCKPPCF